MSEVIYDRKAAIRNATIYANPLLLALAALVSRKSVLGYILVGIAVLWAIGGLTANVRAIRHGFRNLDRFLK
jgi:hypothetical protein